MTVILQLLVSGLGMGCIYAMIALGFVLLYRAVNVVNFAQGDFVMVGAYLFVLFKMVLHFQYWLAIVAALIGMAALGLLFQVSVFLPFQGRRNAFLPVMISTVGASLVLENSSLLIAGANPIQPPALLSKTTVNVAGIELSTQSLIMIAVTVVLVLLVFWLFEGTWVGKQMQATAQNLHTAKLMGINTKLMIAITFIVSATLGGAAGILFGPVYMVTTTMGSMLALKAFAAAVVGGFTNPVGAIVGGLLIGATETYAAYFLSSAYRDAFSFIVLILFLLVRPEGLFRERIGEKA